MFAIILFFLSILFFAWLKTIWQLPWKYANINNVVSDHISKSGSVLGSLSAPAERDVKLKSRAQPRTGSSCPICKVIQAEPMGPGEVCFWCDVSRYAFAPFYAGIIGSCMTFVFVFALPLKPWFSDWYYAFLLITPYAFYTMFIAYVVICRVSIVGDSSQKVTTFFQLAWVLRGRDIKAIFPNIEDNSKPSSSQPLAAVPSSSGSEAKPAGAAPKAGKEMSEEFIQGKKAETMQLLHLEILPKEFRSVLHADIAHDEFIVWWERPSVAGVTADMKWIIHAFMTGVGLGVWFWIASTVTEKQWPISVMMDSSSRGLLGTTMTVAFLFFLLVAINGCNRMYVLTNKRLIIVAGGILGAHLSATELSSLKYAAVCGYTEWNCGPVLSFSWETPGELRKMPPIATKAFAAMEDMDGFLEAFHLVAPAMNCSEAIREGVRHNRSVWRMHIFFNAISLAVMPIVILYSQIAPLGVTFVLLCVIASLNVCIIQRGLRHQQTTYAPLDQAGFWAHWEEGEDGYESFLSRVVKDSQFHWLNKPNINLPHVHVNIDAVVDKVREIAHPHQGQKSN